MSTELDGMNKAQLLDLFCNLLETSTPETIQRATNSWRKRGGKFALLAGYLDGSVSADDPRWELYKPGDSIKYCPTQS